MKALKSTCLALPLLCVLWIDSALSQSLLVNPQLPDIEVAPVPGVDVVRNVVPGSVPVYAPEAASTEKVTVTRVPAIAPMSSADAIASTAQPTPSVPPPPVNLLSDKDSTLTARERANVAVSKRWVDGPRNDASGAGANGTIMFRFGSAMPTIVCAPLYVCEVALQAGEVVNGIDVGDSVRWKISPSLSGSGDSLTVHVVIKPQDIGLTTNLLVTTDRRVYSIKLVSRRDDWMPAIAFSYPEDEAAAWAAVRREQASVAAATVIPETGQSIKALDFNYTLRGDSPSWRPLRVYNDGRQTFIQFPPAMASGEAPALVALGESKEKYLVNYRTVGDRFVVDKVLDRAMLVSGVGRKQTAVRIDRSK